MDMIDRRLTSPRARNAAFLACLMAAVIAAEGVVATVVAGVAVLGAWYVGFTDPDAG